MDANRIILNTALILAWSVIYPMAATGEVSDRLMSWPLKVENRPGRVVIMRDSTPVATYVYRDEEIKRPYFANVNTPNGLPITRHHPPRPESDAADHPTMH